MAESPLLPIPLLVVYCVLTLLASLAGGLIPLYVRLTHTRLQVATSFVAGLMLGVALLHLAPHAWADAHSADLVMRWLLAGFLTMFFVQRFFHFHHHDVAEEDPDCAGAHDHAAPGHEHCHHEDHSTLADQSARQLSWGGAALGLSLHSLIDGIALAASVQAELRGPAEHWLAGAGTFAVVILHKPFDAMAVGTLMAAGGWSRSSRHIVNVLFSLVIPLGVLAFYLGSSHFSGADHHFLGVALAFTAGTFVCIAASDLLPELQFHSHDRIKLSLALVAGLVFAALIGRLEGEGHGHGDDGHETAPRLESGTTR